MNLTDEDYFWVQAEITAVARQLLEVVAEHTGAFLAELGWDRCIAGQLRPGLGQDIRGTVVLFCASRYSGRHRDRHTQPLRHPTEHPVHNTIAPPKRDGWTAE